MGDVQQCPSCGSGQTEGQRFCGSCGARLDALIDAGEPREERRFATVMFADFSGFTRLSEHLDPEDVKAIGSNVTRQMGELVVLYGGTIVNVLGDGIMAVFGAPSAHEDDAERAVRCALEMVVSVEVPPESVGEGGLHIGINTGQVMAGAVGPAEHREYAVMGDVTNTAARLGAAAGTGQVLVGFETRNATEHAIEYEELEAVVAKGKRDPITPWLALRPRGAPVRPISGTPFVGRNTQLELIRDTWEQTRAESRPALLAVWGVAGIGKSRLVREFLGGLEPPASVLRGRSLPYGEATGYDAFVQILRTAARIEEADPVEVERDKVERLVAGLIPGNESSTVAEHVAVLLGFSTSATPDRQPLFGSIRSLVEALGRRTPTVLVLEDLHWAPPSTLALIEFLATRLRDTAVLVLTTSRPDLLESQPSWGGSLPLYLAVDLEPLRDAEAKRLAASLLPSIEHGEVDLEQVVSAGGGNPLFLEEFATSVAERSAEPDAGIPATVQAVIASRIDSLPLAERDALLAASVAGRVFSRGTVAALVGGSVDEPLDRLEHRDFIRREPGSDESSDPRYLFKHILTVDVAYETLPRKARPALHAAAARHLEVSRGDRIRDEAALVGRHWQLAGDPGRAVPYLLMAADGAARTWAKERAIELYGEALDLLGEKGDRATIERAMLERARALLATNEFGPGTQVDIERLMNSADPGTAALATELRARLAYWSGDADGARIHAEAALVRAEKGENAAIASRALGLLGEVRAMGGELDEAEKLSLAGVSDWPEDARDGNYAYTCTMLGLIHYWRGDHSEAFRWADIGYRRGVETSHLGATVQGAAQASLALTGSSRYEESLEWIERAVTAGKEWEPKPQLTSRAVNIWAGTLRELGDWETSRRVSEEAKELASSASFPGARISAGIDLLTLDLLEGNFGEASTKFPGLLEEAEGTKGWHQWLFGGRLVEAQARIEIGSGRPEEAAATATRALELARGKGRRKYVCRSLTTLGEALLALGRAEEAETVLREAVRQAEVLGHAPAVLAASRGLAEVLDRVGADDEAAALRTSGDEAIADVAAQLSGERRKTFLGRATGFGTIST